MNPLDRLDALEEQLVSDLRRDAAVIGAAFLEGNLAAMFIRQDVPGVTAVKIKTDELADFSVRVALAIATRAEEAWIKRRKEIGAAMSRIEEGGILDHP